MAQNLEEMSRFFEVRLDIYEETILQRVDGADRYYQETAGLLPELPEIKLLDLGCGTGLELEEIFKRFPGTEVTGIDLSAKMLERLRDKFPDKADQLHLIQGSYFDVPFGSGCFDAAVSVQTMHHFPPERKLTLYRKVFESLKAGGQYIETDYTALDEKMEKQFFRELERLKAEQGLPEDQFYHFDTPCAVETQIRLFQQAGFTDVRLAWRFEGTSIICGRKAAPFSV